MPRGKGQHTKYTQKQWKEWKQGGGEPSGASSSWSASPPAPALQDKKLEPWKEKKQEPQKQKDDGEDMKADLVNRLGALKGMRKIMVIEADKELLERQISVIEKQLAALKPHPEQLEAAETKFALAVDRVLRNEVALAKAQESLKTALQHREQCGAELEAINSAIQEENAKNERANTAVSEDAKIEMAKMRAEMFLRAEASKAEMVGLTAMMSRVLAVAAPHMSAEDVTFATTRVASVNAACAPHVIDLLTQTIDEDEVPPPPADAKADGDVPAEAKDPKTPTRKTAAKDKDWIKPVEEDDEQRRVRSRSPKDRVAAAAASFPVPMSDATQK